MCFDVILYGSRYGSGRFRRRLRGGRAWRGRLVGPALAHEANNVLQCWELAEPEVLIAGNVVVPSDLGEYLGLFDRVDAEVGLEIEVESQHVGRVVGLLSHDADHLCLDVVGGRRCLRDSRFRR